MKTYLKMPHYVYDSDFAQSMAMLTGNRRMSDYGAHGGYPFPRRPSVFRRHKSVGPPIADSVMSIEQEDRGFLDQFRSNSAALREVMAEFLGTLVLTLCGTAIGAVVAFQGLSNIALIVGPLGWGFSVGLAIYIAGGPAGAHLNPAVSLALATVGKLKWSKLIHYMLAQYLGAFLSAGILYGVYKDSFDRLDGGAKLTGNGGNTTSGIFSCFPQDHVSTLACLADQVLGTALLLIAVLAITDDKNMKVPTGQQPVAIGFSLTCIIMAFGYNCGAPLNPARDLGPRTFTAIAGWGSEVFSYRDYWFWVPIVGPHLGGILGAWLYKLMVEIHWPLEPPLREEIRLPQWKHESISTINTNVPLDNNRSSNHHY